MAGAPLGTRTAAKQSESKSKLMPNLFESRGLRRLWASHGQLFPNPITEGLPTIREVTWSKHCECYGDFTPATHARAEIWPNEQSRLVWDQRRAASHDA
jgi:hypothetical protein